MNTSVLAATKIPYLHKLNSVPAIKDSYKIIYNFQQWTKSSLFQMGNITQSQ